MNQIKDIIYNTFFMPTRRTGLFLVLGLGILLFQQGILLAQQQGQMEVAETDEVTGRAVRFNFNFTSQELKNLFEWLSRETDLTIIASESDIQGKRFTLINLNDVTLDEVIEKIKTVLAQYGLTFVRVDSTLLVTTFDKATKMNVPVKLIPADPEQVEMTDEIQTYIIQLENADASEQASALKPLLNQQANIFADAMTNSLVITDVSSNVRKVVTILQFADEGERFPIKVAIVPLTNVNVTLLEQTLTNILEDNKDAVASTPGQVGIDAEQVKQALEQGLGIELIRGMIKVYADENSNSLIIKASEENIIILKEIIRLLDKASTIQTEIRTYRLKYASAENVVRTIEQIITGGVDQTGEDGRWNIEKMRAELRERGESDNLYQGVVGLVNLSRNDRLNIVVVSSDPRNYPIIEHLINELDVEATREELKMYILEYAKAQTLAANLQDLFEGGSAGQDRNRPWWDRTNRDATENAGFGVQGEVNFVTDSRLNALLISTASQNFPLIDDLISRIDVSMPDQEWGTRFFYLKYADAENVAVLLNTIYKGDTSGGGGGSSFSSPFFFLRSRQSTPQEQGVLSGMVYAEPYPNLNAILVSTGTKRNFDLIAELMKQIDIPTPEAQVEVTETIRLEYARADSLAEILSQVWQDPQAEDQGFSFGSFFRSRFEESEPTDINTLFGKVTVFADPATNSLIVTTRKRYLEQVRELIRKLDFTRGQVWIDIKILEVTLDESTKFGLEVTANEKKLGGIELASGNPLIGEIESQLGLQQEISGFNYSIATKEYMALLHTLIRENKVTTISTPSLLTRDSKAATWSSGRRIPYLQSVDTNSILGDTATQPLFNYDFIDPPIGINMQITPYIARSKAGDDGKRTIGLAIANLSASNFIEFTDFNAPITDDNTLSVVIDVEDGQQLVIGGIIRNQQKQIENKVPILGDIPLLGNLFKSTETEVQSTEIVFIITPHIVDIQNPEDIENLKQKELDWRSQGIDGN